METVQIKTHPLRQTKNILPAPESKIPQDNTNTNKTMTDDRNDDSHNATIQKLQHVLPPYTTYSVPETDENIEFIESIDMDNNTPVINILISVTKMKAGIPPSAHNSIQHINPMSTQILTKNTEVNTNDLYALQDHLLQPTPSNFFTPFCRQYFHVDTCANVHATTNKKDFLVFYHHKKTINIAAGQEAQSEGFGIVLIQLIPNQPPIPFAPVYYCRTAIMGTLSPQCLQLYNKCDDITHNLFQHLSFICLSQHTEVQLPTTKHNNLDFIFLPIMHFSNNILHAPTVATMYTGGLNNQLIHQRFDHQSMDHILKMKKGKLMDRLPTNITRFHDEYSHVYFDELNVGLKSPHKPKFSSTLIETYPKLPGPTKLDISETKIQQIPISQHPITTYKIILPEFNETCTLKFYDDAAFGLPYIKSISLLQLKINCYK